MPLAVRIKLEETNVIFGITGRLGSGKSELAQNLLKYTPNLTIVELDEVRRYALWRSSEDHHCHLRQKLAAAFDLATFGDLFWLERDKFTERCFQTEQDLDIYRNIAFPILYADVKKKIKSPTVIVWAYLLEEHYYPLLTGPVLITDCSTDEVFRRIGIADTVNIDKRMVHEPTLAQRIQFCSKMNLPYHIIDAQTNLSTVYDNL